VNEKVAILALQIEYKRRQKRRIIAERRRVENKRANRSAQINAMQLNAQDRENDSIDLGGLDEDQEDMRLDYAFSQPGESYDYSNTSYAALQKAKNACNNNADPLSNFQFASMQNSINQIYNAPPSPSIRPWNRENLFRRQEKKGKNSGEVVHISTK